MWPKVWQPDRTYSSEAQAYWKQEIGDKKSNRYKEWQHSEDREAQAQRERVNAEEEAGADGEDCKMKNEDGDIDSIPESQQRWEADPELLGKASGKSTQRKQFWQYVKFNVEPKRSRTYPWTVQFWELKDLEDLHPDIAEQTYGQQTDGKTGKAKNKGYSNEKGGKAWKDKGKGKSKNKSKGNEKGGKKGKNKGGKGKGWKRGEDLVTGEGWQAATASRPEERAESDADRARNSRGSNRRSDSEEEA